MLTGVHFILTYMCNFECDHCFLSCGPSAKGTFNLDQVDTVLSELQELGTVDTIGFEGGEPFLFHPLLCESVRLATAKGFKTAVQTNCYWATTEDDAALWLKPLMAAGLSMLEVSDDSFHHGDEDNNCAKRASSAAGRIGLKVNSICIQPPRVGQHEGHAKGAPIYLGGPKLRGRAYAKLADDLPRTDCRKFIECPYEDFKSPQRVHVDAFGHVHICQGLSMGNMWQTPLAALIRQYDFHTHPICGPMQYGGPVGLAKTHKVVHEETYVDPCHMCTHICGQLIDRYPQYLAPRQVYVLD